MSKCPKCNGTKLADSGGVHPWGEPILIECDCIIEEAMTDMRKQFESWLEDVHGLYGEDIEWQPERNCYAKFGIHLAWCAWQASRAAIEIELKQFDHFQICHYGAEEKYADGYIDAQNNANKAIEKAGLKVKQ